MLYLSLAFIVIGVGFLKSSISNMVGELYGPDDNRRDGGFTLFYMGINLGAFVAGLVCGYLGQTYGWRYGFGLAGIGMLAGLFTFVRGRRLLLGAGEPPAGSELGRSMFGGHHPRAGHLGRGRSSPSSRCGRSCSTSAWSAACCWSVAAPSSAGSSGSRSRAAPRWNATVRWWYSG